MKVSAFAASRLENNVDVLAMEGAAEAFRGGGAGWSDCRAPESEMIVCRRCHGEQPCEVYSWYSFLLQDGTNFVGFAIGPFSNVPAFE